MSWINGIFFHKYRIWRGLAGWMICSTFNRIEMTIKFKLTYGLHVDLFWNIWIELTWTNNLSYFCIKMTKKNDETSQRINDKHSIFTQNNREWTKIYQLILVIFSPKIIWASEILILHEWKVFFCMKSVLKSSRIWQNVHQIGVSKFCLWFSISAVIFRCMTNKS